MAPPPTIPVTINGTIFQLDVGKTYCGAQEEIVLFLQQAEEQGLDLSLGSLSDWLNSPKVDSFFS